MSTALKTRPERPKYKRPQRRVTMLQPQAYDEALMPSLRLARSSRLAHRVGKVLVVMLVTWLVLVFFAPWQQNIRGSGNVIGFYPQDRPQTIEAPIPGRISRLGEGIVENARVEKGQIIAEIEDLDESYLMRLEAQRDARELKVEYLENLMNANERSRDAAISARDTVDRQVRNYELVKDQVIAAADAMVEADKSRVASAEQRLVEHRATLKQIELDFERKRQQFEREYIGSLAMQEAERKLGESQAKVSQAEADVEAAKAQLKSSMAERNARENRAQADIEYVTSQLQKAIGDVAKSEGEIDKVSSDLETAKAEFLDAETKLSRQGAQTIRSPMDGIVTQITPNLGSQMLKQGDPICIIVPDAEERAVQIWLEGNDATIVEEGRHVRLQFEGWPAVQFAGWPSVAVGTFGGTVVSIDATDDGHGKFRALIRPDDTDQPWPERRFLRQGVRANAWVMLDQVPLWYEIWRQLNGFPPVVDVGREAYSSGAKPSVPKP